MATQKIEKQAVRKIYARQSVRGRGRPKNAKPLVYIQTGYDPEIYEKLSKYCKSRGVNESDVIRQLVGNAFSSFLI
jgi:allophanate hydrolase subunit 1